MTLFPPQAAPGWNTIPPTASHRLAPDTGVNYLMAARRPE